MSRLLFCRSIIRVIKYLATMMDQNMSQMPAGAVCRCPHHKVVPGLIALIGLVFLLQALEVLSSELVGYIWPTALLIIGLMKMSYHRCKCCSTPWR